MLARAEVHPGVSFLLAEGPEGLPAGPFEVIVSNSALNWVPDHPAVLAALASRLAPGGQLAIQMPFNPGSAFVGCCAEVAASQDFAAELGGSRYESPVLAPEAYARQLERLGFDEIRAGAWLYPQRHASVEGLVDFARGGLLSAYRGRLAPERFEAFVAAYRAALARELGPGPVFFPFQRVLAWGRRR
jgi:trans-aconitate 2-methyltransferase